MEQMQSTLVEPEHATAAGVIERIATLTTATAMVAYGLSRRNVPGVFLAAAATPLAYRKAVCYYGKEIFASTRFRTH